jgi:hypothetical protein
MQHMSAQSDEQIPTPSGAGAVALHIVDDRYPDTRSLCGILNPSSVALRSAARKLPQAVICPKCLERMTSDKA